VRSVRHAGDAVRDPTAGMAITDPNWHSPIRDMKQLGIRKYERLSCLVHFVLMTRRLAEVLKWKVSLIFTLDTSITYCF
jgi:hypothetical protein